MEIEPSTKSNKDCKLPGVDVCLVDISAAAVACGNFQVPFL